MNPFTYPSWDLVSMTQEDSLPYTGVTFGEQLNTPGSFNASLPLADARVQALDWNNSSRPGRTLVCVDLGGSIVWGGIIWTRQYKDASKTLSVGATEVGSYFQQRVQAADYSTTWAAGLDPMQIAKKVIQDALAVSGGSIAGGITVTLNPSVGSGTTIAPSYPGTQLSTVESVVSTLSSMGYSFGYDFSFDVQYLPGTKTPGVTLNLWYPVQGRPATSSQILINHKDVVDFTYDEDATKQATGIFVSGSSNIPSVELSTPVPGYPLLEAVYSFADVTDLNVLGRIAQSEASLVTFPVVTPTLTIPVPVPDPVTGLTDQSQLSFGQFGLGDGLIHRIDPVAPLGTPQSENICPRFPQGLSFEWRLNGWTCTVRDAGLPTLLFDLGVPLYSATLPPTQPPL